MPADPLHWSIGMASRRITPAIGSPMAGFDARKAPSNAVHDDLHARALVFDSGSARTALVSVEVIAVSQPFADSVRARIEAATGIPAGAVFLSATHTHCGPVTLHHFFNQGQPLDEAYLAELADGIVHAVEAAVHGLRPRTLRSGLVPCDGIAVNRRTSDGLPVDPFAGILLVEEPAGEPAAVAVFYACHTTVLGPDTLSFTQDFPCYTLARLKSALGDRVEVLYFNGAQGDLSIGHKSDLSAVGVVDSFRTFATAQRLGERLADAVLAGLPALAPEPPTLALATRTVHLPLKSYGPLASMTAAREQALSSLAADPASLTLRQRALFARIEEYYAMLYEASPAAEPRTLPVEFTAILLGQTLLLTLPGEIFIRVALAIRERSPFPRTLFLGLTNNYIGYLPDDEASASSGYEVIASRVPAAAGRILQHEARKLFAQLQPGFEEGRA